MNRVRKQDKQEEARASGTARPRGSVPRFLINVLNGTFLTRERVLRNMPFLLYLAFLMLLYIGYGYYTERTVRDLHRMDAELKEQRSEHVTVRAQLDSIEQQSRVASDIADLGLRESRVPPTQMPVPEDQALHRSDR